jgi:hypothetical protein
MIESFHSFVLPVHNVRCDDPNNIRILFTKKDRCDKPKYRE